MIGRFLAGGFEGGRAVDGRPLPDLGRPVAAPRARPRGARPAAAGVRALGREGLARQSWPAREIARITRIVHVANDVEALHRIGGVDAAVEMLRARRRHRVRPGARRRVLRPRRRAARRPRRASTAGTPSSTGTPRWSASSATTSSTRRWRPSPTTPTSSRRGYLGHSRGVAQLAAAAAGDRRPADRRRRPGPPRRRWSHDVGTIGVSAGILDKPGPLTGARAGAGAHPPVPDRPDLRRSPRRCAEIGQLAAMHHERMDGSGYPRGPDRRRPRR